MPEGALQLNGPGLKIVTRCDGQHTFREIVDELQSEYQAQSTQIEEDTAAFLEKLREKRVVDY
jgi:coenzyme PQQ biosynthesis protein PqqD